MAKIKDVRYDFHITISVHILIYNGKNKLLLLKRPDTWEWAPGRWGVTGGKLYEHETYVEAIKRKTKQEIGFELLPEGLYEIKQLIIKDKQAHMIFFAAKYNGQKLDGEMIEYKWFDSDEIRKAPASFFAEFYYKDMLTQFLKGNKELLPMSKLESLNYPVLGETKEYKRWFKGVINKSYNPELVADFVKWKKKKS
jgi:ADP-ribose pyrophosphatase YjhB (NUDIX family)